MSYDSGPSIRHRCEMAKAEGSTAFKKALIARTKLARELSGFTQQAVATVLQMPQDRWKQYETRSAIPHEFISPFCVLVRVSETWLLTGKGRGPSEPAITETDQPARLRA